MENMHELANIKNIILDSFDSLKLSTFYLYQSDFKYGSYIINKPGIYKLQEDIIFNPRKNINVQANNVEPIIRIPIIQLHNFCKSLF